MTELAFDLGAAAIVAFCAYVGYRRGFFLSLVDALFMLTTLIVSLQWAPPLASRVSEALGWSTGPALIGITLTLVVLLDVGRRSVRRVIEDNLRRVGHARYGASLPSRVLGVVPGTIRAAAAILLLGTIIFIQPLDQSSVGAVLSRGKAVADVLVPGSVEMMQVLLVPGPTAGSADAGTFVGDSASLIVPFAPGRTSQLSAGQARDFLAMTNLARAQAGVPILTSESSLDRVAGDHTLDMIHRAYFSHDTPEGLTPADRFRSAGVGYRALAENIVLAPTLEAAFRLLMNSPSHRRNQLSPDFRRVGIGVAPIDQRLMMTIDFAD